MAEVGEKEITIGKGEVCAESKSFIYVGERLQTKGKSAEAEITIENKGHRDIV